MSAEGMLLSQTFFETVKGHTGWLLPVLDLSLARSGIVRGDIGAVAVGIGPGAFTGVKVGVTTAKAVAIGLSVPLYTMSTLDLLAAATVLEEGSVIATIDARRGMVYAAAYRVESGLSRRVTDYEITGVADIAGMVSDACEPVEVLGFIPPPLEPETSEEGPGGIRVRGALPEARYLVEPAAGGHTGAEVAPDTAEPIYLKKPV